MSNKGVCLNNSIVLDALVRGASLISTIDELSSGIPSKFLYISSSKLVPAVLPSNIIIMEWSLSDAELRENTVLPAFGNKKALAKLRTAGPNMFANAGFPKATDVGCGSILMFVAWV